MAGTGGIQTAVALVGGAGDEPGDDSQLEQLELLEADAPLPLPPAVLGPGRSGPQGGRPPGRRNKSTEAWRQHFLSRYRSPLIALGEIYSRPADELAREMQLWRRDELGNVLKDADGKPLLAAGAVLDVLKVQIQAMQAVLPYTHQRQPLAVTIEERKLGVLVIGDIGEADAGEHRLPVIEAEENQGVSSLDAIKSDGNQSDGGE